MTKRVRILAVCGFGIGSSLLFRMNIEKVMKEAGLDAAVSTCDVDLAADTPCDIVFTSAELGERLKTMLNVPVLIVLNILDLKEIREKGIPEVQKLQNEEKV